MLSDSRGQRYKANAHRVSSADARVGVWQRDGDYTADVRATSHLSVEDERTQRLLPNAPHSATAETAHAGIFPDDVVSQQRHRHPRGIFDCLQFYIEST